MPTARDQGVAGAVQQALCYEARLGSTERIQVRVQDGVVQLIGDVRSAGERQSAEEAARAVPGVVRVDNGLTVYLNGERSDRELQTAVEQALAKEPDLASSVGCRVDDGVVSLLGHVSNLSQEARAIQVAGSVQGVEDVASTLAIGEVAPVAEQLVDNATLADRVADALAGAGVWIFDGRPEAAEGEVTLRGKVRSRADRQRAAGAVANVVGVRAVKNRLVVSKDLASGDADERLAAEVVRALREDGRVSPASVMVRVVGGTAYLSGSVNSPDDQNAATEVAQSVPGIRRVVSDVLLANWHATDRFVGRPRD